MGKKSDLSDFERGMIVGARRAGCSVSRAAEALGFSRTTVSRVFREWSEKQKTSSNRRSCGRKPLVDERGRRRMARIVEANVRATTREITTEFNSGSQKVISERTAYRTLCRMGYNNRRPPAARNRAVPLHWTPEQHSWTAADSVWSDESELEDCVPAEVPQDPCAVSPMSPVTQVSPESQVSQTCPLTQVSQISHVSPVSHGSAVSPLTQVSHLSPVSQAFAD